MVNHPFLKVHLHLNLHEYFFILVNYYCHVSFNFTVILCVAKIIQHTTELKGPYVSV